VAATTTAAASHLGRFKIFIDTPFVLSSGGAGIPTAVIPPFSIPPLSLTAV
jgi:hypothetical protein